MSNALTFKDVSVTLGKSGASGGVRALDNVSLILQTGKIVGVIGPSGAGKTTLIRVMVGSLMADTGSIEVLGQPAGTAAVRGQVSYMTQSLSVYPDLTVTENLEYFATMVGIKRSERQVAVSAALKAVQLADKATTLIVDLSGGQKQRVSLAIALLGNPKIVIMDEPTVGLDPVLRDKIWRLFNRLTAQGKTLIVSSHAMDEAERCDDLVLIRDGRVLAHATPAELRKRTASKTVEHSFLKLIDEAIQ